MDEERDYRGGRKKYGKYSQPGGKGIISKFLAFILTVFAAAFVAQVYLLDMFPSTYVYIGAGVLALIALLVWILAFRRSLFGRFLGSLIALAVIAVLAVGNYYIYQTQETIEEVTDAGSKTVVQTDEMIFIAMKDSGFAGLNDLAGARLGIQSRMDRENTDKTLAELQSKIDTPPVTVEYSGMADMVQALYDKDVDAILFNDSYKDLVTDEFQDFDDMTIVLDKIVYETEIDVAEQQQNKPERVERVVTQDTFIVYFSGIDTYGDVGSRSRSDVNIMAVINPVTRQILLVTTPRDYYVALPFGADCMDKLTHAGIYGIDCSIETLENLYGIQIDNYVRMNFTGFMDIVDALGGVDVYSSQSFVGEVGHHSFSQGYNTVNGEEALSFVRERHSFIDGDFQRQRNQMEMIKAIVKKIASPAILTSYTSLLSSLQNSFTTDLKGEQISALVKMQLENGGDWNVQTYGVSGTGARRTTYSMGNRSLYVSLQDKDSIAGAKAMMQKVADGEILTDSDNVFGDQE